MFFAEGSSYWTGDSVLVLGVLTEKVDSNVIASVLFIDFTAVKQSVTLETNRNQVIKENIEIK